jgi:cellulose synthase/poly-beta-1,6-N-acetylglucosamine synthase-like glycosyltransferase
MPGTLSSGIRSRRPFFRTMSPAAWVALVMSLLALCLVFCPNAHQTQIDQIFIALFVFRYLRLLVHMVAYWMYVPAPPVPAGTKPKFDSQDVTVILPTIDPHNPNFVQCLNRLVANGPAKIFIVTAGDDRLEDVNAVINEWRANHPDLALLVEIEVGAIEEARKRNQVAHVVPKVTTDIVVSVDDSVIWPPTMLRRMLDCFEDDNCGFVGTNKVVTRDFTKSWFGQAWNFLGCTYLLRHTFDLRAQNSIDGSVFVISGRTAAIRTEIMKTEGFLEGLVHERFFFKLFGPLTPDDDNFITRWVLRHGWSIKFQDAGEESCMETRLGEFPRFLGQCERWVRTTWRSNSASLFTDGTCWGRWPWTSYAAFFSSFFNFALFYDPLMLVMLRKTTFFEESGWSIFWAMVAWILASKVVKLVPHFVRHPTDLQFFPFYYLFAYFHSLIKLWALITFWDNKWAGRQLEEKKKEEVVAPAPQAAA